MSNHPTPCEYMKLPSKEKQIVDCAEMAQSCILKIIKSGIDAKVQELFGDPLEYSQNLISKKKCLDPEKVKALRDYFIQIEELQKELENILFPEKA